MQNPSCFITYFSATFIYLRGVIELVKDDNFLVAKSSLFISAGVGTVSYLTNTDLFGVSNFLLLLVFGTVCLNTIFGIKKSLIKYREAKEKMLEFPEGSPEYRMQTKLMERYRFDMKKLQFVVFKCFTLVAYLYFVKVLSEDGGDEMSLTTVEGFLDFTTAVLIKAPVAIFWYNEFKSIGDNSEYVYNKKAPIFTIIEGIFEPRILKFYNKDKNEPST